MLGNESFFFNSTTKYINYFGTLFNDIHITRTDNDGNRIQLYRVPISYGPKDPFFVRPDADPEIQRDTAIIFPRMSYELDGAPIRDNNRQLGIIHRYIAKNTSDKDTVKRQFNAIPYNFNFALYIASKDITDANKIIEQILPFFAPEMTYTVNTIPEMGIKHDIPIVLNSIDYRDTYQGEFTDRRQILWTLNFTLRGYYYAPIVNKAWIKSANVNVLVGTPETTNVVAENIYIIPGVDANGNPTSNSSIAVDTSNVAIDDTFGYIITRKTYPEAD
jgi:hypothetical protein